MSGIYGLLNSSGDQYDLQPVFKCIETELTHRPWYKFDTWINEHEGVGLGRVRSGAFNAEAQPVMSDDGCLVLFMSGEFYYTDPVRAKLAAAGFVPRNGSHAELALTAFQCYGKNFATELNGIFSIAVYDMSRHHLVIANDRFGMYPIYVCARDGQLAFAPEVKGVLSTPVSRRKLNLVAMAEFIRFQQVLEDHTFHEDITQLPYASIGQYDMQTGAWTVERYWDWDHIPHNPDIAFEDAVREAGRLLRRAVEERTSDSLRPGVFLSGGLDSRTMLGLMRPRQEPVVTGTFGAENCRDVHYAGQIARLMKTKHFWFDLPDGRWVAENADLHLSLTEGFVSWLHMHGITMLPTLREHMDYNLTGWEGAVLGHPDQILPELIDPADDHALLVAAHKHQVNHYTWPGVKEAEERILFTPEYASQVNGLAFDSFAQNFQRYLKFRRDNAAEYHMMVNATFRLTRNMNITARSHVDVRFPLWDYDFINFIYSVPSALRGRHTLYRHLLTRELPALSRIPFDKNEFIPSVVPWRYKLQSSSVRLRRRLKIFPNRATLYADYENYLRRDLRPWAENILYDRRTEERGIFDMRAVRSLMGRHLAGHEAWTIGKISHLVTFEMMMRRYFDN